MLSLVCSETLLAMIKASLLKSKGYDENRDPGHIKIFLKRQRQRNFAQIHYEQAVYTTEAILASPQGW